jgi:hypothetical protein
MTGVKTKTLRRMLKKAGLKTSGRKATLTKRAKKAHLVRGGQAYNTPSNGSAEEFAEVPKMGGYTGDGNVSYGTMEAPGRVGDPYMLSTGGRRGVSAKKLKRALKKAGLKTTGRKAALSQRVKKAHLKVGGTYSSSATPEQYNPLNASGVWGASN